MDDFDDIVIEKLKNSTDLYKIPMSKKLELDQIKISNKILGQGAFGKVVLANDKLTNEEYAVKIIQREKNQDAQIKLILQELKILSQLSHPNIVKFFSVNKDNKQFYIIMQYIKGGSLQQLLEERKKSGEKLSEEQIVLIVKHILEGICYLHSHDVVHRDIKPDNILLQNKHDFSSVKIVDFGLASEIDRNSVVMSDFCGTKLYMAPEILDEIYTKSVDVWSVGIILFQLLTNGSHPFYETNDTQDQFFKNLQNKQEYDFRKIQFSHMAQDLLQRLICKNPSFRYNASQALKHPFISQQNKSIPLTADQNLQAIDTIKQLITFLKTMQLIEFIKKKQEFYEKREQKFFCVLEKYKIQQEQENNKEPQNKYYYRILTQKCEIMKKTKFQKMKEYNQRLSNSSIKSEDNQDSASQIKKRNPTRKSSLFAQNTSQKKSSPDVGNQLNSNNTNNVLANIFVQEQQEEKENGRIRRQSDDFTCHSPNLRKPPQIQNQNPLIPNKDKPPSILKQSAGRQRSFKVLPQSDSNNTKDKMKPNDQQSGSGGFKGLKPQFSKTAHISRGSLDFNQKQVYSDQKNGQKVLLQQGQNKIISDFSIAPIPKPQEIIKKRKSFQNGFPAEQFPNIHLLQQKIDALPEGLPKIQKKKSKSDAFALKNL